jgi:hypothetical protein
VGTWEGAAARLAHAGACRRLADSARLQVNTSADDVALPGELTEYAAALVQEAAQVLQLAIATERARGASWESIGEAIDLEGPETRARFAPVVKQIQERIVTPGAPQLDGDPEWLTLPEGIHSPDRALRDLDEWAIRHHERGEPAGEFDRPVSAGIAASLFSREA